MSAASINIPGAGAPSFRPSVTTSTNLPASGNNPGDLIVAQDTGIAYGWTGSAWVAQGTGGSGGTVTNVTGSAPIIVGSGTTTPAISITKSDATHNGYLSSTDWTTFNNKQGTAAKNAANGYAGLDANSRIVTAQLPASNIWGSLYIVAPGGLYTTIQSAINQAVTDGHTSSENSPATILVYPKQDGTGYTEDLTLKDGINIIGYTGVKNYNVLINGQLTYTPQSASGFIDATIYISGLYIRAGVGKHGVNLTGSNVGRLFISNCFITKTGDTATIILMNGAAGSSIELTSNVDGGIDSSAAGCLIYDIQSGSLQSYGALSISSTPARAGKILNCGATGVVNLFFLQANCSGANAITIANGGSVTLSSCSITNVAANSNGANITAGGTLTSLQVLWNIPSGTGRAIVGSLGSVWVYANNAFVANKTYSTAIGAGAVALSITPVAG